jgi:hypothetical protein
MLYENGTISYTHRRFIRILCSFTFQIMPFDEHNCPIRAFVVNEDKDSVKLELLNPVSDISLNTTTSRAVRFDEPSSTFVIEFDYLT